MGQEWDIATQGGPVPGRNYLNCSHGNHKKPLVFYLPGRLVSTFYPLVASNILGFWKGLTTGACGQLRLFTLDAFQIQLYYSLLSFHCAPTDAPSSTEPAPIVTSETVSPCRLWQRSEKEHTGGSWDWNGHPSSSAGPVVAFVEWADFINVAVCMMGLFPVSTQQQQHHLPEVLTLILLQRNPLITPHWLWHIAGTEWVGYQTLHFIVSAHRLYVLQYKPFLSFCSTSLMVFFPPFWSEQWVSAFRYGL